jgi:hypothetical protein
MYPPEKSQRLLFIILAIFMLITVESWVSIASLNKTHEWQRLSSNEKAVFVGGFMKGAIAKVLVMSQQEWDVIAKCTNNWTLGQIAAVIDKYLKENPHEWDKGLAIIIPSALTDACRKRGFKTR